MRTLDRAGLLRRLDADGMTLPNGRARGATEQAWRGVAIAVHPSWGTDEVWFDVSAQPMRTQADVDALSAFMRTLGRVVGHRVELSSEGRDDDVLAAHDPDDDAFSWTDG